MVTGVMEPAGPLVMRIDLKGAAGRGTGGDDRQILGKEQQGFVGRPDDGKRARRFEMPDRCL